jgi:hypothetical protein
VPLIPLWATSTLGGTVDSAPNREAGDDCAHPQARTETLVQPRIEITNLVWITSFTTSGLIGGGYGIGTAISVCTQEAQDAGFTNTDAILSWLSDDATDDQPASLIDDPGSVGPIQTANGTTVAQSLADLANLQVPIGRDVHGNQLDPDTSTWTGTEPNGTVSSFNCSGWDSNSASDGGSGGFVGGLGPLWTTGNFGGCDEIRHLICFLLDPAQLD